MAPERPTVLIACDHFVRQSSALAAALGGLGCQAALLTRDHDHEFGERPGAALAHVREALEGAGVRHYLLPGRIRQIGALPGILALRREIATLAPEVVHVHDSIATDPRLVYTAGLRRGRYALTVHDPTPHPGDVPQPWRQRQARRLLLANAGVVFVHGEELAAELAQVAGPAAPIVSVPLGSDFAEPGDLPEQPTLLFFGRQSAYKGLDVLLDALPVVWEGHPQVTLVVAGAGELPAHELFEDPRVVVRNEHIPDEDIAALFTDASCVVLPYRQASQSAVGLQAMRYGRPIVATTVGGLPELVGDDAGLLVAPGSAEELAGALARLISDRELASRLGRAGASRARDIFGWPRVAEMTLAAYEKHLLGGVPAMAHSNSAS